MKFARWVFGIATVFGMLSVPPMFFMEESILGASVAGQVRALYYGFASVTLAWQVVYLLIAFAPARYRPLMLIGAAGKTGFGIAVCWLWFSGALGFSSFLPGLIDLFLSALFVAAFAVTPRPGSAQE